MTINWSALQQQTRQFTSNTVQKNEKGAVSSVIYSGLHAKLSDLAASFGTYPGTDLIRGIFIYVDTLVIDTNKLPASTGVIMARQVVTTPLDGQPLVFESPNLENIMFEILVGSFDGPPLALLPTGAGHAKPVQLQQQGATSPAIGYYTVAEDGTGDFTLDSEAATFQDLVVRPWALNALRCSFFLAGSRTFSVTGSSDQVAIAALSWVRYISTTARIGEVKAGGEFSELVNNASALLVMLNVAHGAVYVPVLSAAYYGQEITSFLTALQDYESKENTLATAQNINQAINQVVTGLQSAGTAELAPLQAELEKVENNIKELAAGIHQLREAFFLQETTTDKLLGELNIAIVREKYENILTAMFDIAMKLMSATFDIAAAVAEPEKALEAIKYAIEALVEAGKGVAELIEAAKKEGPEGGELIDTAAELSQSQAKIGGNMGLAGATKVGAEGNEVATDKLSIGAVDPQLEWENFFVEVNRKLSNIKLIIGDGANAEKAQEAANNFLASLQVLGNYGKSISAKYAVLADQVARAGQLINRITAAKAIVANWKSISARANSDEEKLAALKGLIQNRENSIKRSVFDAWLNYRNAYYYLYFQEPPVTISLTMDAAALKAQFATVKTWVGRLLGDDPEGKKIELPDENVKVELEFPIIPHDEKNTLGHNVARFKAADDNGPDRITWNIPFGTKQLDGVLPNGGEVAIWIESAEFFLDGVIPNSKHNVLVAIETSGTYLNGYSPQALNVFVNKPMQGNYAYTQNPDGSRTVYDKWSIDPDVYASPTPYTQWRMDFQSGNPTKASKLRMSLSIAFRSKK